MRAVITHVVDGASSPFKSARSCFLEVEWYPIQLRRSDGPSPYVIPDFLFWQKHRAEYRMNKIIIYRAQMRRLPRKLFLLILQHNTYRIYLWSKFYIKIK